MEEIIKIINQLREESSTNGKLKILKDNKDNELLKKVLYYTYNDNLQYGIREKSINILENVAEFNMDIFGLLDILSSSNINDSLKATVNSFLGSISNKEERALYKCILLRDLRCNISTKLINKAIPKLIPEFNIQQAYPIDKYYPKKNEWHVLEEKLNGINGSVLNDNIISRQGKIINGLQHIIEQLNKTSFNGYYFNGELVRKNIDNISNGENFRETTSIVNSDDTDKSCIDFVVFDLLPVEEFNEGKSKLKYKDRLKQLKQLDKEAKELGLSNLSIPKIYYEGEDISNIDYYLEQATKEDKEGLMYIKNNQWKNKRHSGILKVKKFLNADCEIIGYEEGTGRLEGKLGAFVIDYKGNKVNVGSGYTDDERIQFWQHRDDYIGRILQVKFKEQTKDKKTGLVSIQFPIYQCISEIGKEVSYNG